MRVARRNNSTRVDRDVADWRTRIHLGSHSARDKKGDESRSRSFESGDSNSIRRSACVRRQVRRARYFDVYGMNGLYAKLTGLSVKNKRKTNIGLRDACFGNDCSTLINRAASIFALGGLLLAHVDSERTLHFSTGKLINSVFTRENNYYIEGI